MSSNKPRPPYFKYAFLNAYNLSVVGGSLLAGLATQEWWIAAMGLGAEALWMLFAPDSKLLQVAWFDKYHAEELAKAREAELNAKFAMLPVEDANRCRGLRVVRDQIWLLAKDNAAFTQDLLGAELGKLDQLVESFLDIASVSNRYSSYLRSVDTRQISTDIHRFEQQIEHTEDATKRNVAQKNLAVLQRRRDMYAEIASDYQTSRSQLDLIENTFKLLADQVVTMKSPGELSGQLNELIEGVESIRKSARETEKVIASLDQQLG